MSTGLKHYVIWCIVSLIIGFASGVNAASYPLTFYVPFPEADELAALQAIGAGGPGVAPANPVTTYISIAAISDGTIIRYDQWEDGYDPAGDNEAPLQATTQIWGDNNPANGFPPGNTNDYIKAGTVVLLANQLDASDPYSMDYDARDRIAANRTISVTRTFWATGSGTLMAGCVEVFDLSLWGTNYLVPIGVNIPDGVSANDGDHQMFEYTGLSIMAAEDGTIVRVDKDSNGSFETTNTLNRGQTVFVNGGVNVGGRVLANKPVQVVMLSGDVGSNYESRDSSLLPVSRWSGSYYTPVSTPAGDATRVWLYNPSASSAITVYTDYRVGAGAVTRSNATVVAANSYASVLLPVNVGAHFYTTNRATQVFYAYSTTDSDTSTVTDNQAWDWSFTLFPEELLSPQIVVGLGVGRDPNSGVNLNENGNPVWVTPVGNGESNITVYVDYNGDNVGPYADPNGFRYDISYSLKEMQQQKIYDPDGDQTATLIYVLSTNVTLAAAWGQDPLTATAGEPGLDVGTSIPPQDVLDVAKTLSVVGDADGDGQLGPSDQVEYVIMIANSARAIIPAALVVKDVLSPDTTYVTNTTFYRDGTAGSWVAVADDLSGTPFPLDGTGRYFNVAVAISNAFYIRFQAQVAAYSNLTPSIRSIINTGSVRSVSYNRTLYYENDTPLRGSLGDRVWNDSNTNGLQDVGESGIDGVLVYLDVNTNGVYDDFEPSSMTHGGGYYLLTGPYLLTGTHVVRVDPASLPVGALATYDRDGTGTLNRATVTLSAGQDRTDVDFGYRMPPFPLSIVKASGAVAPGLKPLQTNTYTVIVSNTGTVTQTGIQITDILPDTLSYVPNSTFVTGYKGGGRRHQHLPGRVQCADLHEQQRLAQLDR